MGFESDPSVSRKGHYRLCDPFLAFWFRFVAPHRSLLEAGYDVPVRQRVEAGLGQFLSFTFEDLCREWVVQQTAQGKLPFLLERLGSWWDRDAEIDVVALSDHEGAKLVGECKWWAQPVGENVLDELVHKAYRMDRSRRRVSRNSCRGWA